MENWKRLPREVVSLEVLGDVWMKPLGTWFDDGTKSVKVTTALDDGEGSFILDHSMIQKICNQLIDTTITPPAASPPC